MPLSWNISSLPLILAGPILRKVEPGKLNTSNIVVEPSKVSVWVALKSSRTVTLKVFDHDGNIVITGSQQTIALGTNLYVAVVTAKSTVGGNNFLVSDKTYYYDLNFNAGETLNLNSATGGVSFTFGNYVVPGVGYKLPSFSLPPTNINDLRIVHGSCRKPHGGEDSGRYDALGAMFEIISEAQSFAVDAATDSHGVFDLESYSIAYGKARPHQLFLTGDQIYADDVADALLYMISEAGNQFLGWQEALPTSPSATSLAVGARVDLMEDVAKFSAGDAAKSHLIKLHEYYFMYLFVWSDVLWPINLPAFSDVFPNTPEQKEEIANYAGIYIKRMVNTDKADSFYKERKSLSELKSQLVDIRKALANIPTYMIFDDHDVSDDWNITKSWVNDVDNSEFGLRVIQNALTAYTVFQAWGNASDTYTTSSSTGLLKTIENWRGANDANLARLKDFFHLPSTNSSANRAAFSYFINFNNFQVIVLDSRTHRGFPTDDRGAPILLDDNAINQQLLTPKSQQTTDTEFTLVISPAPVVGHPFIEEIAQPLAVKIYNQLGKRGEEEQDNEAWISNKEGFEKILEAIGSFSRTIILSGDVHYSFSAAVEYWNQRGTTEKQSIILQLTASSLKNETMLTKGLASCTFADDLNGDSGDIEVLAWDIGSSRPVYEQVGTNLGRKAIKIGSRYIALKKFADAIITPTNYQYRVKFYSDNRDQNTRGSTSLAVSDLPNTPPGSFSLISIIDFRRRMKWDSMRTSVGYNNIGEIRFFWGQIEKSVAQMYWYSPADNANTIYPYTSIELKFEIPSAGDKPLY